MSDLIDRESAIVRACAVIKDDGVAYDVLQALKAIPSAQPQRIKGRWERKESDLSWWYECSECGESPLFDPYEHEVRSYFCPWCGARMEEEEDETD